jgi:hypothetical protein
MLLAVGLYRVLHDCARQEEQTFQQARWAGIWPKGCTFQPFPTGETTAYPCSSFPQDESLKNGIFPA